MSGRDGKRGRECNGERDEGVGEKESVCVRGEKVLGEGGRGRGKRVRGGESVGESVYKGKERISEREIEVCVREMKKVCVCVFV